MEIFLISLLIFVLRVVEVGIATIRIVMLVRERSLLAGMLGVVQSVIWVFAAGIVLTNLDSLPRILAFSLGFGVGTALGSVIEQRLAIGHSILRVVTSTGSAPVADSLREAGYGVTELNASGLRGDVRIAFTVVPRKRTRDVLGRVRELNDGAFVTVQSVSTPDIHHRKHRIRP
jgi:uncharacterized protein YebE (UPF0316 family)